MNTNIINIGKSLILSRFLISGKNPARVIMSGAKNSILTLFIFSILFFKTSVANSQSFFTAQKIDSVTSLSGQITRSLNLDNNVGIKSVTVINRDTNTILISFGDSTQFAPVFANERVTFPNTSSGTITLKGVASKVYIFTRYGIGPGINYNLPSGTKINTSNFASLTGKNIYTDLNTYLDSTLIRAKLRLFREVSSNNSTVYNEIWIDSVAGFGGTHKQNNYLNSTAAIWAYYSNLTGITGTDGFIIQFNSGLQFDWKEGTDWSFLSNAAEVMKFNSNRELLLRGANDQGAFDFQMAPNSSPIFGSGGLFYLHAGSSPREFINFDVGASGRSLAFILPHDNSGEAGFFFQNNAGTNLIKYQADKTAITESDFIFYFGEIATDGTWRLKRNGNNFVFERRESGIYVPKQTITP